MIEQLQAVAGAGLARADLIQATQPAQEAARIGALSFGEIMRDRIAASIDSVKAAESVSVAGIKGQADVRAVSDAVMEAERNLQAAVAIRDKIVTAYLDMTRMAI